MHVQAQTCADCGAGRLYLPLSAFARRSVVVMCSRCGRRYCSQLSGPLNIIRKFLITGLGTVLGGGLVLIFFGRWGVWLGGLIAFSALDAMCIGLLHRLNMARRRITMLLSA
jgi:uncharacterized protein (DUF983 family)